VCYRLYDKLDDGLYVIGWMKGCVVLAEIQIPAGLDEEGPEWL
jgi:hypothetical protein